MNILGLLAAMSLGADTPTPEAVELKTKTGSIFGCYDLPTGTGPWPIVILHAGSGPTDRDGNSAFTKNDALKKLGEALKDAGYACLRFDKRGVGESMKALGKEEDLRLSTYADDIVAWTAKVRDDKRFTKVAFIGHSEGSLLGSLAAPDAKFDAFISLCGAGRKFGDLLREQLKANMKDKYELCEKVIDKMEAGKNYDEELPIELAPLFRKSVQPYLISMVKPDPAELVGKIAAPVLVLSGTTDIQVKESDYDLLKKSKKEIKAVRIENMNHVLKEVRSSVPLVQGQSYTDAKVELHPKLAGEIVGFLKGALAEKK